MESIDIGLLVLRVVAGLLLVGHGAQKLLGWFGGHGLAGTGGFFEHLGYRPGRTHAALAGLTEVGGGLLLAVGLLTPLGAAAIVGVMLNAGGVHWPKLWATDGGIEYTLVLGTIAAALAFTGPGEASLDAALDLDLAGTRWGVAAVALGLAAGAALLASRRPAPPTGEVRGDGEAQEERQPVSSSA